MWAVAELVGARGTQKETALQCSDGVVMFLNLRYINS